ncbi:MAG: FeoB-associated Cys-rich membrane protein [Pedobacter sp.]|nr:MAG: FeoB-associated Cys-rich membrane protein [Pedobacter sp.]
MNIQFILVIVIFICALLYVGRIIYRAIWPKNAGCSSGCGKCSVDFEKISETKS